MKNKIKFGLKEFFRPTPEVIEKFLLGMKGVLALPVIDAIQNQNWKNAVIIMVIGFVIDHACKFIGKHPELFAVEEAEAAIKDKVEEAANEIKENENDIPK